MLTITHNLTHDIAKEVIRTSYFRKDIIVPYQSVTMIQLIFYHRFRIPYSVCILTLIWIGIDWYGWIKRTTSLKCNHLSSFNHLHQPINRSINQVKLEPSILVRRYRRIALAYLQVPLGNINAEKCRMTTEP